MSNSSSNSLWETTSVAGLADSSSIWVSFIPDGVELELDEVLAPPLNNEPSDPSGLA